MKTFAWVVGLVGMAWLRLYSADFTNLTFAEADIIPFRYDLYPVDKALPGWEVYNNGHRYTGLIPYETGVQTRPIQLQRGDVFYLNRGQHEIPFQLSIYPGDFLWPNFGKWYEWREVDLIQTGRVPDNAVRFDYGTLYGHGHPPFGEIVKVALEKDGRLIAEPTRAASPIDQFGEFYMYDVTAYRGQELTIHLHVDPYVRGDIVKILGFSSIPEPSTWVLLLSGGATLGLLSRRTNGFSRKHRSCQRVDRG